MLRLNKRYCIKIHKTNKTSTFNKFLYKGFTLERAHNFYKRRAHTKKRTTKYYSHISKYREGHKWDGFGTTKRQHTFQY